MSRQDALCHRTMNDDFFASHAHEYLEKRDILLVALRRAGFRVSAVPKGAYYLFADYLAVPRLKGLAKSNNLGCDHSNGLFSR